MFCMLANHWLPAQNPCDHFNPLSFHAYIAQLVPPAHVITTFFGGLPWGDGSCGSGSYPPSMAWKQEISCVPEPHLRNEAENSPKATSLLSFYLCPILLPTFPYGFLLKTLPHYLSVNPHLQRGWSPTSRAQDKAHVKETTLTWKGLEGSY